MNTVHLTVLYGSQTGTAQDIAEEIWRQSKKFNFQGPVLSMNDYNIANLINEKLIIFVCSTTGQGDEPDNMKTFWKFLLRKTLPRNSLGDMHFAVLGLGDSSYPKFNYVAKRLYKRLIQLSAKPIIQLGLCDDQHDMGPAFVYLKWINELWSNLKVVFNVKEENINEDFIFKWNIETLDVNNYTHANMENLLRPTTSKSYEIKLMSNIRTTEEDHFQDVRLLSFSCDNEVKWNPGDVIILKPWNSDETVDRFFNILSEQDLDFDRNTIIKIKQNEEEIQIPTYFEQKLSLELVAKYVWDLNSVPRQSFFKLLAINCKNDLEKEKLLEFSTPEGLEDMLNYAIRPKRTIVEVLQDFPHATSKLNLQQLFEMLPTIKSRSFSIASVPEYGSLQLLVAVVEYRTILKEPRKGLCSNWLKNLKVGDQIYATFKSGILKIPKNLDIPIIMIGPGTGVAPFRSLLLQRESHEEISRQNLILFFGCRSQYKDFHCKEDWYRMMSKGILKCFFAFSRDQENKRYVQHVIEEQGELLKRLIMDEQGVVFVAGNSKNMPNCVREAFAKILEDMNFVERLQKELRYQEDTW